MDSGHKMWIPFTIIVFANCFVGTSGTECVVNRCPGDETCFQRNVPGQPDYVCECTRPYFHGYDCTETFNNRVLQTCYGEACATGSYTTPNYETTGYENREKILVLLYIPRATEIRFSFDPGFQIERNADELFVGRGLTVPYNDFAEGTHSALIPNLYFFDGVGAPQPFSVYNDTAFIFFESDRQSTYAGFRIFWNATVADPPQTTEAPPTEAPPTEAPPTAEDMGTTESAASAIVLQTGLLTTLLINIAVATLVHM
ncbi:uncharacterized protein LOC119728267 [Patiria miniata]|uniref:EGF-like domain-containing protein n=1 Tax=Patiria miniata TaxID=46514 RepID=A0A913ZXT6_PATMI|nr:uncharacterized protein LOC119728267 [Patiria miniata]